MSNQKQKNIATKSINTHISIKNNYEFNDSYGKITYNKFKYIALLILMDFVQSMNGFFLASEA